MASPIEWNRIWRTPPITHIQNSLLCEPASKIRTPKNMTTFGAFPLYGTVRFGTARYGTVRLSSGRFAFPPQFSTAIEWAGLFTRRYNCAASTAVTSS